MDNETRQKIQRLENSLSRAEDKLRILPVLQYKIEELSEKIKNQEIDIQILKDGGNI